MTEPGSKPLTTGKNKTQHERFCQYYSKCIDGTKAAIKAGFKGKTATSQASRLLTKVNVKERIAFLSKKKCDKIETDAEWLLKRLREEADADISQIYDEEGNLRSIHDWPLIFRQGLVQGIDTATLGQDGPVTVDKIKMADRNKKLELIGRHVNVQAFKDTEDKNVIHSFEGKVSEELLKLITGT